MQLYQKPSTSQMLERIQGYKKSLALDEVTLAEIASFPIEEQLGTLKMIHHFDVAVSRLAIQKGARVH